MLVIRLFFVRINRMILEINWLKLYFNEVEGVFMRLEKNIVTFFVSKQKDVIIMKAFYQHSYRIFKIYRMPLGLWQTGRLLPPV